MASDLVVTNVGGRKVCIGGIGKLFYENGFPISMAVSELKKRGIEVSIFHVADECLKNGWPPETTYRKLVDDFSQDIDKNEIDLSALEKFCNETYENQRTIIFEYLFPNTEVAKDWLSNQII